MMRNSQIRWKQERSNMMAEELADPVGATKLLVFMCLDCPSPWGKMEPSRAQVPLHHTPPFIDRGVNRGHYTRSGGRGAHLVLIKRHSAHAGMQATQGGEGEVGRGMEAARRGEGMEAPTAAIRRERGKGDRETDRRDATDP